MNLEKLTKIELQEIAKRKKLSGISKMTKEKLIEALSVFYNKTNNNKNSKQKYDLFMSHPTIEEIMGSSYHGKSSSGTAINNTEKKVKPKKDEYPIPEYYNKDMLALLPIDPSREYVYWEVSDFTLSDVRIKLALKEVNLLLKIFTQSNSKSIDIATVPISRIGSWFFNMHLPEATIWSEIGVIDRNGIFYSILKSNILTMPADKVSDIVDEETWLTMGRNLDKLYGLSGLGLNDLGASRSKHDNILRELSLSIGSSGNLMKDK